MQITEVRIRLMPDNGPFKAYCAITLNGQFVVKDMRIIDGNNGLFVAMPSRRLEDRCDKCGCKNHRLAKFCNECGTRLAQNPAPMDKRGRPKLNIDLAHPADLPCRQRFERQIIEAYNKELQTSQQPGYQPKELDHPPSGSESPE